MYTFERNFQILISLMKEHNIRKVICDPGTTNIALVASLQRDPFFELFSSVDERSAAYIACGMAAQSGEPVALTCTGATASRNYMPGLTEAYYRKLPVLAITAMQHPGKIGQLLPQILDRSVLPNDIVKYSVTVPSPQTSEDLCMCNRLINEALLELYRDGGGPVHINIQTCHSTDFSVDSLPKERVIRRYTVLDSLPSIPDVKVGIFVGNHQPFSIDETEAVNTFCKQFGSVVICDQTSNYRGPYRVLAPLIAKQDLSHPDCCKFDLLIHIGQVSGAYMNVSAREVWRVNEDGEVHDTFGSLTKVFQMSEKFFFESYSKDRRQNKQNASLLNEWQKQDLAVRANIPELPFSNLWMAQQTAEKLPSGCVLHLAILNSLRSWNFFETPDSVAVYANTGGFGIDGALSTVLGAALASPEKLFFLVVGDLAFFYDMNALGNRHLPSNLRILLINNGVGTEFKNYSHPASMFGDDADPFIAAAGHFGHKSHDLVKHYAEDLGFDYYAVEDKMSYIDVLPSFLEPKPHESPLLIEAFTNDSDESEALRLMSTLIVDSKDVAKKAVKDAAKKVLGGKGIQVVKSVLGK